MKIAVGSENPVKIEAVKKAFKVVWPKKKWEVVGIDVFSGVSAQPMSDSESIKGATTRARKALRKTDSFYGIGIEGGLQKIDKKWFDSGWVVIVDKRGKIGVASSVRAHTPSKMLKMIKKGVELGVVDDILFGKKNSKQKEGHFGLITNNLITRTKGYTDAVIVALASFIHPKLFGK
jgi:inosine/xanthosine triphosphatase